MPIYKLSFLVFVFLPYLVFIIIIIQYKSEKEEKHNCTIMKNHFKMTLENTYVGVAGLIVPWTLVRYP